VFGYCKPYFFSHGSHLKTEVETQFMRRKFYLLLLHSSSVFGIAVAVVVVIWKKIVL
jgi:hypothetical protein